MAKHTGHRSGGGRTTPKGTRPAGTDAGHRHEHREAGLPRAPRIDPAAGQAAAHVAHAPVRAGHNRGQR